MNEKELRLIGVQVAMAHMIAIMIKLMDFKDLSSWTFTMNLMSQWMDIPEFKKIQNELGDLTSVINILQEAQDKIKQLEPYKSD